ncbi:MAG: AmmeMemoRadiSam system protein B, partial [Dehalococcoidia bacterium]
MPGIVYGCITPHPPVMLSQIGKGREAEVSASIEAMGQVCRELAQQKVDSALIVSPHGTVFSDAMGILTAPYCQGSMLQWGASGIDYRFENDLELVTALQDQAGDAGISLNSIGHSGYDLDHGVMVPAYFLIDVLKTRPLVPLSFSMLPLETHLEFGRAVGRAALRTGKRVAFIASGDLSHRLLPEAPAGFDPLGQVFDQEVTKAVSSLDSQVIMNMDRELVTRAGECGLRSIVVLLGALEGRGVTPKVLSYEGPFGVGYLTASFVVAEKADETEEHPLVQLARETVEQYVHTYTVKEPSVELSEEMRQQAGVFVSIKRAGHLRGCVGTA